MKKIITISVLLFGLGLIGGFAASTAEKAAALSAKAEKVQKGDAAIKAKALKKGYGMALDRRYHKIHSKVAKFECATCHSDRPPPSQVIFSAPPAVDVSPSAPGPVDRRVCLGCHLGGPGREFYGPSKR